MSAILLRGPFHKQFFARYSNSIKILPCCNSITGHHITTKFCTCYNITAVLWYSKFYNNRFVRIKGRSKRNFHWNWIVMESRQWNGPLASSDYYCAKNLVLLQLPRDIPRLSRPYVRRRSRPVQSVTPACDNWVQCDRCNKWRRLPPYHRPDYLPDMW